MAYTNVTTFAIDFKGHKNLIAHEINSAVGMIGLYVPALVQDGCGSNSAEFDFRSFDFASRVANGEFRPVSKVSP